MDVPLACKFCGEQQEIQINEDTIKGFTELKKEGRCPGCHATYEFKITQKWKKPKLR